nr:ECF-type sigma factor [Lysobacter sp. CAU 1642]
MLQAAGAGDRQAADCAFAMVYDELQRLARRQLQGSSSGPSATSLVHEVYLRLARSDGVQTTDRQHFFAVAARAMRQLLIDHARERCAAKRGGGQSDQTLDGIAESLGEAGAAERLIALDQSLERLEAFDPSLVSLVDMRFFAGLELEEIAALTGRSERTLKRDWRKARAVLHAAMG